MRPGDLVWHAQVVGSMVEMVDRLVVAVVEDGQRMVAIR
jgi:hypothetical protein